mmetsp:Transcript_27913/g.42943  ORF Transcript_27913/g.42943 Transcript_27913/m.42943 type:complete len:138 (-) Transcript_27913:36-449(-)
MRVNKRQLAHGAQRILTISTTVLLTPLAPNLLYCAIAVSNTLEALSISNAAIVESPATVVDSAKIPVAATKKREKKLFFILLRLVLACYCIWDCGRCSCLWAVFGLVFESFQKHLQHLLNNPEAKLHTQYLSNPTVG